MRRRSILACGAIAVAITALATATAVAHDHGRSHNKSGFRTSKPAMLTGVKAGVDITPLLTVGDILNSGFRFEAIPDGISLRKRGSGRLDLLVNHETSKVPFPYVTPGPTEANSENDFDNAQVSQLSPEPAFGRRPQRQVRDPESARLPALLLELPRHEKEGFSRDIFFTNEETPDYVFRQEDSWPPPIGDPAEREAGLVVARDVRNGKQHPIYGMGRHNHENSVAIPGYGSRSSSRATTRSRAGRSARSRAFPMCRPRSRSSTRTWRPAPMS